MDTTQLLKGVLDLAVLAVVADEDGYGYDVVRRLRAAGIDEVGDASVYGTLRRLYAAGALGILLTGPGDYSLDAIFGFGILSTPNIAWAALVIGVVGGLLNLLARRRPATA